MNNTTNSETEYTHDSGEFTQIEYARRLFYFFKQGLTIMQAGEFIVHTDGGTETGFDIVNNGRVIYHGEAGEDAPLMVEYSLETFKREYEEAKASEGELLPVHTAPAAKAEPSDDDPIIDGRRYSILGTIYRLNENTPDGYLETVYYAGSSFHRGYEVIEYRRLHAMPGSSSWRIVTDDLTGVRPAVIEYLLEGGLDAWPSYLEDRVAAAAQRLDGEPAPAL